MSRTHPAIMVALAAGIAGLLWVAAAAGQGADAPAAASAGGAGETISQVQTTGSQTTLWGLIKVGGPIMVPLGLLSVAAIALTVYGFMTVMTSRMLRPELVPTLQNELENLNLDNAKSICAGSPSLLTNTLHAGLERISDGVVDVPSMEKAMEEASVQETAAVLKPVSYLSIVAQIAPMLGLLGTVTGMIKAFQKIGLGAMGDPEKLAADIGEAMVTTAAGLIIGIPAMFFYFYLKSRCTTNVSRLARILGNLLHVLVAASRRASRRPTAAEGGDATAPADTAG